MEKIYHIKNMVCTRCLMIVQKIFEEAHFEVKELQLGMVVVEANAYSHTDEDLNAALRFYDLELLQSAEKILVEQVKSTIVQYIHLSKSSPRNKLSDYLSTQLELPYPWLRKTFQSETQQTIEKYYMLQKVERAKELIQYNRLSIKEIAYELGYSSLQHLSNQFKSITGYSPKAYKNAQVNLRIPVDRVLSMVG